MIDINEVKDNILRFQDDEIKAMIDEIEYKCNLNHLNEVEKLIEILSYYDELFLLKDNLIYESDIEEFLSDDLIIESYWKAKNSAKNNNVSLSEKGGYIIGFLIGYLSEHIRISKRLKGLY